MAGVNSRKGVTLFQRQTAVGTPAPGTTNTTNGNLFGQTKTGGGIKDNRTRADVGTTRPTNARPTQYVQNARGEGTINMLAIPEALGCLLYEVCGTQSVTGVPPLTTAPYAHTFILNDDLPLPLTVWDLVGDEWWMFPDCYVQQLVIRGQSGQNVATEAHFVSFGVSVPAGAPSGYATLAVADDPRFKFIGSAASFLASGYPATVVNNLESFELNIDRTLDLRYGTSLVPNRFTPVRNVDFSASFIYDSAQAGGWDFVHASAFGATSGLAGNAAGNAMTQELLNGSFDVKTGRHPADSARYLEVLTPAANWQHTVARPDSNPAGGPLQFDAAGPVVDPASVGAAAGSEVTINLVNDYRGQSALYTGLY